MRLPLFVLGMFVCLAVCLPELAVFAQDSSAAATDPASADDVNVTDDVNVIPVVLLVVGIVSVLGMIIGLKLNAFLALIISALIVSLGVGLVDGEDAGSRMNAVVKGFGGAAGSIGIVIAMAAIIGKCMLDSGAADRVVRSAVNVTGEKNASFGLMLSGFVLAIPVFFDTVFYLLVPLARSLYRRTGQHYLRYLMAIATGGAITHTLVPPTPGPLLVSSILGVEIGVMMLVGTMVAIPAAIVGLIYSVVADKKMPVEMRPLGTSEEKHEPLPEDKLPSLWVSLLPVVLPVVLIGAGTLAVTLADREDRAKLAVADIQDFEALATLMSDPEAVTPAGRVVASRKLSDDERQLLGEPAEDEASKAKVVALLNQVLLDEELYDEQAFLGIAISDVPKSMLKADQLRMKPVDRRRMNRSLLEDAYPEVFRKHQWNSPKREISNKLSLWSNANFALMLAALCAMLTLKTVRGISWRSLGEDVEIALMSGGVIILITAAGGAFGAMLQDTHISDTIKDFFSGRGASGIALLIASLGNRRGLEGGPGQQHGGHDHRRGDDVGDHRGRETRLQHGLCGHGRWHGFADGILDERQRVLGLHQDGRTHRRRIAPQLDTAADGLVDRRIAGHDCIEQAAADAGPAMSWRGDADERSTVTAGCIMAIGSALLTCLMLFINGSLVMAVLTAVARSGPSWASKPEFSQFMLFLVPVLLVVAEWVMIDYVRTRLRQQPTE